MKIRKILLVTCAFYTAAFSGNAFAQFDTLMQSMQQVVQQLDAQKSSKVNETNQEVIVIKGDPKEELSENSKFVSFEGRLFLPMRTYEDGDMG